MTAIALRRPSQAWPVVLVVACVCLVALGLMHAVSPARHRAAPAVLIADGGTD